MDEYKRRGVSADQQAA